MTKCYKVNQEYRKSHIENIGIKYRNQDNSQIANRKYKNGHLSTGAQTARHRRPPSTARRLIIYFPY